MVIRCIYAKRYFILCVMKKLGGLAKTASVEEFTVHTGTWNHLRCNEMISYKADNHCMCQTAMNINMEREKSMIMIRPSF